MTGSDRGAGRNDGAAMSDRLLLALGIAAGAAIRFIPPWSAVFAGPGAFLLSPDPYYHLRRIQYAVAHFPTILGFDPYVNFPEGALIIWPAGFDLFLAAAARIVAPSGDPAAIERVCALAIPLLGLAAVVAVYALARQSLPRPGAGAAAVTFALLPIPVFYSHLGYVDHHVLEPLFLALGAALLLLAWKRAGAGAVALGAAAGVTATIACAFAPAGLTTAVLLCALATLEGALGRFPGSRAGGLAAVIAGTLTLAALAALTPWGRSGEMTYLALSAFQSHLAFAAAGLGCSLILLRWRTLPPGRRLAGAAAGLAITVAALVHGGRALLEPLREAAGFLGRTEPLIATVVESMPLWARPPSYLLEWLTPIGLLAPVLLLAALWRERRSPAGPVALLAIVLYAIGLSQLRFMVLGGVAIAWGAGWAVGRLWHAEAVARDPRRRRAAVIALLIAGVAGVYGSAELRTHSEAPGPDVQALWAALEHRRDPAAGLLRMDSAPRWGVAAPWEIGHFLLYEAGAPVVASPFGQAPWHIEGIRRGIRLLLTDSNAAALESCRQLRVRYVVTTDPYRTVSEAAMMGLPIQKYARSVDAAEGAIDLSPHFWSSTAMRLQLLDGSSRLRPELKGRSFRTLVERSTPGGSAVRIPSMPSFRLVWESEGRLSNIPKGYLSDGVQPSVYKLFEVVAGARIEGRCTPGSHVLVNVPVETNTGRRFEWTDAAACRADGRYRLRTPYPSTAIRVSQGGEEREVAVTEADVEGGGLVAAELVP